MGYNDIGTTASGATITAAFLNLIRDNFRWLVGSSTGGAPACRVYAAASQTISDQTITAVPMTAERFDPQGMHSTVSNTSRVTIPAGAAGRYLIGGHCEWSAVSNAGRRELGVRVNGDTEIAWTGTAATSGRTKQSIVTYYELAVGDYVQLVGWQNAGESVDMVATGNFSPELWVVWDKGPSA